MKDLMLRYLFRRQFIVGPKLFMPNKFWESQSIMHGMHISAHRDLPFVVSKSQNLSIAIIGIAIDPFRPKIKESEIARELLKKGSNIQSVIDGTRALSGRWVIIFQNYHDTFVFTDPTGFRTVYYYKKGDITWFGSQPEIIKRNTKLDLREDSELVGFLRSEKFRQKESAWIGNKTIYENCYALIPNHYLQVLQAKMVRFFPLCPFRRDDISEGICDAIAILKGSMEAITDRFTVKQGLTAGYDSRILLAASFDVVDQIQLFVERNGLLPMRHSDVVVPLKICKELGLILDVLNSKGNLPGWFTYFLANNVTNARVLIKSNSIFYKLYDHEESIYVGGNIGELFRNPYGEYFLDSKGKTAEELAKIFGYPNEPYVVQELDKWMKGLQLDNIGDLSLGEMLYWEQRLGHWGAQYPSEQDIAAEAFRPFNNRMLIEIILSAQRDYTMEFEGKFIKELISRMWPELLEFPFNPVQINTLDQVKRILPQLLIEKLKFYLR